MNEQLLLEPNPTDLPCAEAHESQNDGTAHNGTTHNGTTHNGAGRNDASYRNGFAFNGSDLHSLAGSLATTNGLAVDAAASLDAMPREVDIARSLGALKPQLAQIEAEIERLVTTWVKSVSDVASHTLGAGGKRLRPALTVLAAQLCDEAAGCPTFQSTLEGQLAPKVLSGAVAIELTHTTTLLHDDVVDAAEVRRGKPAANLIWGNGMSVLVGDYLFAQVFLIASQEGFTELMNPLARATAQMCQGELLEAQNRGRLDMDEREYEEIVALKTAALTECSCRIGAVAVGADEASTKRLALFGHNIGIAFQIIDDIFDITSSRGRIGKPTGNDIREGIITLPMLRAMQSADEAQCEELRRIIGKSPIEDGEVERALTILRAGPAIESARQTALNYIAEAKAQLEIFAPSPARAMLYDIADYVVSRDK